jgi:hypothetical protein
MGSEMAQAIITREQTAALESKQPAARWRAFLALLAVVLIAQIVPDGASSIQGNVQFPYQWN